MRVGSIGYTTYQGLGILLKDFYDNKIVTDVITVAHWKYVNHHWYPGPILNRGQKPLERYFKGLDAFLLFETCFYPSVLEYCKSLGIPTILIPMYECTPDWVVEGVDYIWNPSELDQDHFPQGELLGIPVPRHIKHRVRNEAKVFVHNAGHGGLLGRNGTRELLAAMNHVRSDIKLIVRFQEKPDYTVPYDPRIEYVFDTVSKEELYSIGDVFIFPEKFNGLSLPLQEAFASGMAVMATDRYPMNRWLPKEILIPSTKRVEKSPLLSRNVFCEECTPLDIARTIDNWSGKDITHLSLSGLSYRHQNSWDYWKPIYENKLVQVIEGAKQ